MLFRQASLWVSRRGLLGSSKAVGQTLISLSKLASHLAVADWSVPGHVTQVPGHVRQLVAEYKLLAEHRAPDIYGELPATLP